MKIPSQNRDLDERERLPQTALNENSYISSPLWWFGMLLMMLGELGNFSAYGFAPAGTNDLIIIVLVAPLGTVALVRSIYLTTDL